MPAAARHLWEALLAEGKQRAAKRARVTVLAFQDQVHPHSHAAVQLLVTGRWLRRLGWPRKATRQRMYRPKEVVMLTGG